MYILAIETTGPLGSVAIIDGQGKISMETSGEEMSHLKDLMPMTQKLIDELGISKTDLSAVAASIGPGSFTGIRIGVASARGLTQALDIPCISVPTLDSFKLKCDGVRSVAPIFNARRGQVYGAVFAGDGSDILKAGPYMLEDILAAVRDFPKEVCFYGDGIDAYGDRLAAYELAPPAQRYQTAAMTARAAWEKYEKREFVSVNQLLPDYMRETEAEQKLKAGILAKERAAKMDRFKSR